MLSSILGHNFTPLPEETRAQLYSSMKIISNAHFAEVRAFDDVKIGSWPEK